MLIYDLFILFTFIILTKGFKNKVIKYYLLALTLFSFTNRFDLMIAYSVLMLVFTITGRKLTRYLKHEVVLTYGLVFIYLVVVTIINYIIINNEYITLYTIAADLENFIRVFVLMIFVLYYKANFLDKNNKKSKTFSIDNELAEYFKVSSVIIVILSIIFYFNREIYRNFIDLFYNYNIVMENVIGNGRTTVFFPHPVETSLYSLMGIYTLVKETLNKQKFNYIYVLLLIIIGLLAISKAFILGLIILILLSTKRVIKKLNIKNIRDISRATLIKIIATVSVLIPLLIYFVNKNSYLKFQLNLILTGEFLRQRYGDYGIASSALNIFENAFDLFIGKGFIGGNSRLAENIFIGDSLFISLFVKLGVIGSIFMIAFILLLFIKMKNKTVLIITLFIGFGGNSLFLNRVSDIVWIIVMNEILLGGKIMNNKEKNVSIIHVYSDNNKGDSGIILAMIELAKKFYPKHEIHCHSMWLSAEEMAEESNNIHYQFIDQKNDKNFPSLFPLTKMYEAKNTPQKIGKLMLAGGRLLKGLTLVGMTKLIGEKARFLLFNKKEKEAFDSLCNTDLVLSKGGSFIYNHGGLAKLMSLMFILLPLWLASAMGKKTVVFSQSIGPLNGKFTRYIARKILNKVDYIYVRERYSYDFVKSLNIEKPRLELIPDSAFYLSNPIKENEELKIKTKNNVGITVKQWEHRNSNDKNSKFTKYINTVSNICDYLIEKFDVNIYIIPQVIGPNNDENDALAAKILTDNIKNKDKVEFINGDFSPYELKYIYSQMDMFVGTRLHSNIFALTTGTPVVGISYHGTKTTGTMDLLELGDYVVDINNISEEEFIEKVTAVWNDKEAISKHIVSKIDEFKEIMEEKFSIIYNS